MSMIQTIKDENNALLSRREIVCSFKGLGGKLKKSEAVDMVTKEFSLNEKVVVPIRLKNETGMTNITGTFFVYEDEKLAREHINPTIFRRLDKVKAVEEEAKKAAEETNAESDNANQTDEEEKKEGSKE